MILELSKDEGQALINLLNLAKNGGDLRTADTCVYFWKKIEEAFKVTEEADA